MELLKQAVSSSHPGLLRTVQQRPIRCAFRPPVQTPAEDQLWHAPGFQNFYLQRRFDGCGRVETNLTSGGARYADLQRPRTLADVRFAPESDRITDIGGRLKRL
jgi:hypothetical protein